MRAPADGYTLLLVNSGNAASAALYDRLNFDLLRDITPVAGIIRAPLIIEVNSSIPVKTVPELIAYAKANPGNKVKARFEDLGATVFPGSPADFGKFIAEETEKWGKVIRAANIKPE